MKTFLHKTKSHSIRQFHNCPCHLKFQFLWAEVSLSWCLNPGAYKAKSLILLCTIILKFGNKLKENFASHISAGCLYISISILICYAIPSHSNYIFKRKDSVLSKGGWKRYQVEYWIIGKGCKLGQSICGYIARKIMLILSHF